MAEQSPSDTLMSVFEHASEAKTVGIILEEADGSIRFQCSSDSMITRMGLLTFALCASLGRVLKGLEG